MNLTHDEDRLTARPGVSDMRTTLSPLDLWCPLSDLLCYFGPCTVVLPVVDDLL
jgi:hypothetical protein